LTKKTNKVQKISGLVVVFAAATVAAPMCACVCGCVCDRDRTSLSHSFRMVAGEMVSPFAADVDVSVGGAASVDAETTAVAMKRNLLFLIL